MHTTVSITEPQTSFNMDSIEDASLALTVFCQECNAPKDKYCQQIYWIDGRPNVRPRRHHSVRLKNAKRTGEIRNRKIKGVHSYASNR